MEHSSIVRFIEWNWLGGTTGQLVGRDAVVNNIGNLLDPAKTGTAVPTMSARRSRERSARARDAARARAAVRARQRVGVRAARAGDVSARVVLEGVDPLASATRPLVFVTWHRFNFAATAALRALPPRAPTLVMHDGVASRALTHEASAWLGFETFVFHRRSPVPPRAQLVDYVRATGRSIVNLPDSGGPYGVMKPGILEVARACDALVVPFVVAAQPALTLGRRCATSCRCRSRA